MRAVDAQHHKIQALVDQVRVLLLDRAQRLGLDDSLKLTGPGLQPVGEVLSWLEQYGVVHFDAEEAVMSTLDYPEFEHHKSLHRAFYGQMRMASEVVGKIMSFGGGFHVGPIYVFMAKWVKDHICTLDKSVGKIIENAGVELNETEDIVPPTCFLGLSRNSEEMTHLASMRWPSFQGFGSRGLESVSGIHCIHVPQNPLVCRQDYGMARWFIQGRSVQISDVRLCACCRHCHLHATTCSVRVRV